MRNHQLNTEVQTIVAHTAEEVNHGAADFAALVRAYETDHASGTDTTASLCALAQAVALSVLKKCIDPQRKAAAERVAVSNTGINPALTALRRGIVADIHHLEQLTAAHNAATALRYNADGYIVRDVVDTAADTAATALQGDTLSDGLDLVNAAVVAILEQTEQAERRKDTAAGWMERPCTIRHLTKKVLIRADDAARWDDVDTTPIQEVYRAIRREIQNSRATQTDPRNGYTYIEDTAADPDSTATDTIYRRLHKWADLGGYTMTGHFDQHGNASRGGLYTAGAQTAADYAAILAALNLTERQATIVRLRMSGYGCTAIATYLGVTPRCIEITFSRLREKCEKIGFSPDMWAEMNRNNE